VPETQLLKPLRDEGVHYHLGEVIDDSRDQGQGILSREAAGPDQIRNGQGLLGSVDGEGRGRWPVQTDGSADSVVQEQDQRMEADDKRNQPRQHLAGRTDLGPGKCECIEYDQKHDALLKDRKCPLVAFNAGLEGRPGEFS